MIKLESISYGYEKTRPLFRELSFSVSLGELVVLSGAAGAGKTTLLHLLSGRIKSYEGSISILGHNPDNPSSQCALGIFPQNPVVIPRSVQFYLEQSLWARNCLDSTKSRVKAALHQVGMSNRHDCKVHELSSQELARVYFAATIIHGPQFIVMDDPLFQKDPLWFPDFCRLIEQIIDCGAGVLWLAHQIPTLELVHCRALRISNGQCFAYESC